MINPIVFLGVFYGSVMVSMTGLWLLFDVIGL